MGFQGKLIQVGDDEISPETITRRVWDNLVKRNKGNEVYIKELQNVVEEYSSFVRDV